MREIRIPNPRIISSEKTYFDADYVTGTIVTVINNIGFSANDICVAGESGQDHTEAQQVISITGPSTVNIAASFNYAHNKGTTLYKTVWNQIIIDRQTAGVWTTLVTMDIMWDSRDTLYFDPTGDDTNSYRFRFYNSYSGRYSEYSPTQLGSGLVRNSAGQMIINARNKVRDPNANRFGDDDILTLLQDAQTEIEYHLPKLWFLKVNTWEHSNGIQASGSTFKYALSSYTDFNFLHKIQYVYNTGSAILKWDLEVLSEVEYDRITFNQLRPSNDYVRKYKMLEPDSTSLAGYFEVYPTPLTGSGIFYPTYYRHLTPLASISSITDLPFPQILEDYAAWKMHIILGNTGDQTNPGGPAAKYESLFYGPDQVSSSLHLTGIALLKKYNDERKRVLANGRSLVNFRGHKGINNWYGNGIGTRDFNREYFMD